MGRLNMNALELFRFVVNAVTDRGWGRALRSVVADWYASRPVIEVASDMLKCPEHDGWSHRDLVRMAHPKPATPAQNALFQWAVDGELGHLATPDVVAGELRQVYAVEHLKKTDDEAEALRLVEEYALTHEMVPDEWKRSPAVWESLLTVMSYSDLIQNLAALASAGLLVDESPATALVVARLIDRRRAGQSGLTREDLSRAREEYARHPQSIRVVVDALDTAGKFLRD